MYHHFSFGEYLGYQGDNILAATVSPGGVYGVLSTVIVVVPVNSLV